MAKKKITGLAQSAYKTKPAAMSAARNIRKVQGSDWRTRTVKSGKGYKVISTRRG